MFFIRLRTIICYVLIIVVTISLAGYFGVFANEDGEGIKLPIIMYHAICDTNEKTGKFVISKDAFKKDLEYLKENGYTAIGFNELIDFTENGTPLPEKPVMLTFDDGYYNNYCYAYPLLKEYNQKAVISIIGKYTDLYSESSEENPKYTHITWEQAKEMCESGLVEIQNHSYDSHTIDQGRNGTKKKKGETQTAYAEYIYSDIGKLQQEINENLGYTPLVFTYPFGSISDASYEILKGMGFKATLSCEEKVNFINSGDSEGLYKLGRFLRTPDKSIKKIFTKVMKEG